MSSLQVNNIQTYNSNPPVIKNSSGTEVGTFCRAWVNFNGTGTVAINNSFNVSSITDVSTGQYTINFATAMPALRHCPSTDPMSAFSAFETEKTTLAAFLPNPATFAVNSATPA